MDCLFSFVCVHVYSTKELRKEEADEEEDEETNNFSSFLSSISRACEEVSGNVDEDKTAEK